MIEWWVQREENEVAWKVQLEDLKRGFDLDMKNPNVALSERELSVPECLIAFRKSLDNVTKALAALETEYTHK